jgi:hypothetical protein
MAHLDWSRPIDVHRWSDHQQSNDAALVVFQQIVELRHSKGGRIREPNELKKHIKVFLLDLWLAAQEREPGSRRIAPRWVGISRAKGDYNKGESRYRKLFLSYDHVVNTLDDLIELGYVKQRAGFHDRRTGFGRQTRIRARSKLLRLMNEYGLSTAMIQTVRGETIILRDEHGDDIDYEDTEETMRWRANLERINLGLEKLRIRLYITDDKFRELNERMAADSERGAIDYHRNQLFRVFNNRSFREGGRFYGGWWQGLPKEYRRYLDINRKGTVEYDYSGLHLRILYWKKGLDAPDDPYDIEGIPRDLQKRLVLIILNAESKEKAIKGFREGVPRCDVVEWMDRLSERHEPIKEYFYSGEGVRLQFLDSCVAERVMLKMLDKGRVVLPVHDSFIMRLGLEEELSDAMEESIKEEFPGLKPALKPKETALEELSRQREAEAAESGEEDNLERYFASTNISELINNRSEYYRD